MHAAAGLSRAGTLASPLLKRTVELRLLATRNPMFVFVFVGPLFRFSANAPALPPLFQLPPRMKPWLIIPALHMSMMLPLSQQALAMRETGVSPELLQADGRSRRIALLEFTYPYHKAL